MKKLIMLVVLLPMMALAATWYVNGSTGADSNSGTGESTPMATIQAAIDVADDGDTILVAPGTYAPITTENKNIAIRSITGAISTVIDGGNTNRCVKVLPKSFSGNLQYVVCTNTCIYGFTLQNGYAGEDGYGWKELGLGGGGLCGTYYNCIFLDNKSRGGGGCDSAILHNCLLAGNYAINGGGGDGCIFKNCTIVNNRCKDNGAGTFGSVLENCIAYGNVGNTQYYNVSAWMNDLVRLYGNDFHRTNVFEDDPSFVDATNGDYRLTADSPCIDVGDNSYVMTAADLDGNIRIANGTVDVGCYEYNSTTVLPPTAMYTVTFDANGGDGGWTGIMDYGTEIVAPTVTRDGYIFVGWSPSVAATVPANDVTYTAQWMKNMIRNVTAEQRFPWDGKVDVSFEVVDDIMDELPEGTEPVFSLSATDRTTGSNYVASASALSGNMGTVEGQHHVVWDLNADGIEFKSDDVVFSVAYKMPSLYCVIDLSAGANAASYPVSYLSSVPAGGVDGRIQDYETCFATNRAR